MEYISGKQIAKILVPDTLDQGLSSNSANRPKDSLFIIGVGASAGGFGALEQFFTHLPDISNIAVIVIQHQDPAYKTNLSELLQNFTSMIVVDAGDRMKVIPNYVYITPSDKDLIISNGMLKLLDQPSSRSKHLPIDTFLFSLAADQNESAIAVIFSGMGSDGTCGIAEIKRNNGAVFAQDPVYSKFSGMPQSAIDTGLVDVVAPAGLLPRVILEYLNIDFESQQQESIYKKEDQRALEEIITLLSEQTGNDFSNYKKSTVYRRIERRMSLFQISSIAAYANYLYKNKLELNELVNELLINVTCFFRDPSIWQYLKTVIFPLMLIENPQGKEFRIWIPACSSGEEVYSFAIIFNEMLDHQVATKAEYSLKIFATDLDANVINRARHGHYPSSIREQVSPERLERFFTKDKNGYQVNKEIRKMVVFAVQNIISDLPFSKLDLLSCRNLLIYFDRKLQKELIPLFHYSLNAGGILLLGAAETIDSFHDLFTLVDDKLKIFKRNKNNYMGDKKTGSPESSLPQQCLADNIDSVTMPSKSLSANQKSLQGYSPASVMINDNGDVVYIKSDSRKVLNLTLSKSGQDEEEKNILEELMLELQLAREEIHATHEEMQTSQEELKASYEELQSTNEELQSANKELNLSNEALVSSETKMHLLNEGLQETNTELGTYIEAIGQLALVSVTDRSGRITQANDRFCEVSGYRRAELIDQDHRLLNSGVHTKAFFIEMWATIAHGKIWHQEICNRRKCGALYWVDSTIVPLKDNNGRVTHYISVRVDITTRKMKEMALNERLKERVCLYAIRREMEQDLSTNALFSRVTKHIVSAMQFPEFTAVLIKYHNIKVTTDNYSEDLAHGLFAKITVDENICGELQVFYTNTEPFLLPDEQSLVNIIADDLHLWLERKQVNKRINHMASHDALTGLPNRFLLQDRISQALAHNQRYHGVTAVLFIDLDHFKVINDSLGHDIGDLLLKDVAKRLLSSIRSEDTAARQGGDEFIVVLPHVVNTHDVEVVAQKILNVMALPFHVRTRELHIGASIGIAICPNDGKDSDTLLKHSDTAMYHAKSSGRNKFLFFTQEMDCYATERHDLEVDLRSAIKRNELLLYFQPVVGIVSNKIESMEVLLRWQHSQKGLISPLKFIGLAEETGLIIPIGEWVIRAACLQIKAWQEQGYDVPPLAINLSVNQLEHKSLTKEVASILSETGVVAQSLALEITESMLVGNISGVVETLSQLSEMGFKISIDDFGTGYSNLAYLKHYKIDTLKIDQTFVRDIVSDKNDAAIVTAIIAMAHSLNMKVIAEGVETEEQLAFLSDRKCEQYQGYYFSKPLSAEEITSIL